MKPLFFGNPERRLFGVYHPPRGAAPRPPRAVLICPPLGTEYIRTHWTLRLMAKQLSRKGVHVLRMDYEGTGDSAGSFEDMTSLTTWDENVSDAIKHLKNESGAETVMVAGLRFGATLAHRAASRHPAIVNSIVLWEPLVDPAEYLMQLRALHAKMVDLWVCKMETENSDRREEILGALYSRELIREIEALCGHDVEPEQPQLVFELASQKSLGCSELRKCISVDDEDGWSDLSQLETAWLRPRTLRTIVESINDMFQRLERFGVLGVPIVSPGVMSSPVADTEIGAAR